MAAINSNIIQMQLEIFYYFVFQPYTTLRIKKLIFPAFLFFFVFSLSSVSSQSKFNFNPRLEAGIAYRTGVIELSELSRLPNLYRSYTTYAYSSKKYSNNINLSITLQQSILKQGISLQVASYFKYSHLYYGKNAQGVSSNKEKEYKRLK